MKKNNKGFSLVELIVVVLIMGIIAVALAPQVMKWVDRARQSNDESNRASYESSIETAFAEWQENHSMFSVGVGTSASPIKLIDASSVRNSINTQVPSASSFADYIDEVIGGEYKTSRTGTYFEFTIDDKGKVSVSY